MRHVYTTRAVLVIAVLLAGAATWFAVAVG